jgi:hypothetical protein
MEKIEYRVRPVTRFIVTRYEEASPEAKGSVSQHGEYDNAHIAYEVGYALARAEAERRGFGLGDERMHYPRMTDVFPDQPLDKTMAEAAGIKAA